jgi:hypothetical protein
MDRSADELCIRLILSMPTIPIKFNNGVQTRLLFPSPRVEYKMIFYTSQSIDELLEWYDEIMTEEFVSKWNPASPIYFIDEQNEEPFEDCSAQIMDAEDIPYKDKLKKIHVHLLRQGGEAIDMTLFEIKEMNGWFMKKIIASKPVLGEITNTVPTIWNIFLCQYLTLVRDTLPVSHIIPDESTKPIWITDSVSKVDKGQQVFFGVYELYSSSIYGDNVANRLYFSSKAHSFFMHSIEEEVQLSTGTVYLVGKLFPQWDVRFGEHTDTSGDDLSDMLVMDISNIQIRLYEGNWMKCPRGFEYRSGQGKDAVYMFRSRWLVNPVKKETVEPISSHSLSPVVMVEKKPAKKFRKIHILTEMMCLFEWIKFSLETHFIETPLSTYKFNPRGEHSRIEYRFTKDECRELSTNLPYEGQYEFEWISKILVECMSIRWNSRVLFEEYAAIDSQELECIGTILSNRGSRISYSKYKKARLVSKYVANKVKDWIRNDSYYVIRIVFSGFGEGNKVNVDNWINANKDSFIIVWIHKENEEIAIRCSSPSTELMPWKKEFDYFIAQWFPIEEVGGT